MKTVREVEIEWPDPQFHAEILSRQGREGENPFKPGGDGEAEAGAFGRDLDVSTNDEAELRNFLSEGVRWEIEKLRRQVPVSTYPRTSYNRSL